MHFTGFANVTEITLSEFAMKILNSSFLVNFHFLEIWKQIQFRTGSQYPKADRRLDYSEFPSCWHRGREDSCYQALSSPSKRWAWGLMEFAFQTKLKWGPRRRLLKCTFLISLDPMTKMHMLTLNFQGTFESTANRMCLHAHYRRFLLV